MDKQGNVIIYQSEDGVVRLDVRLEDKTVWLTIDQMSELFGKSRSTINEHILHIYEEGELEEDKTKRKIGISDFSTKPTNLYNLDVIISVGYRVKSIQGTRFRQWATERLHEYIVKGFALDDERLKNLGGGSYWKELLDRIRDIRSSEKVLYRQVLDLYATAVDYDPHSETSRLFFKIVAKNYLSADELKILNRLVSGYFDFAEIQALKHRPMYMEDYVHQLDNNISSIGEEVLTDGGTVSHEEAMEKAVAEYRKFQVKTLSSVEQAYLESIKGIEKKAKRRGNKQ